MSVRLFVGNLPYSATEADIRQHFGAVGDPLQVVIPTDRGPGRPRLHLSTTTIRGVPSGRSATPRPAVQGRPLSVSERVRAKHDRRWAREDSPGHGLRWAAVRDRRWVAAPPEEPKAVRTGSLAEAATTGILVRTSRRKGAADRISRRTAIRKERREGRSRNGSAAACSASKRTRVSATKTTRVWTSISIAGRDSPGRGW